MNDLLASTAPTRRAVGALVASLAATLILSPASGLAESPAAPAGTVILTVAGAEGAAEFDLAALDALPQRETVTATPWHEGVHRFGGPTISAVLEAAGLSGGMLRIAALNDYAAEMPMEDAQTIPVILATRIDGEEITVREKGPIFVIYPFDERPDLFNEVYFNRSVWQVNAIEVSP